MIDRRHEALVKVIRAARLAENVAGLFQKTMVGSGSLSLIDEVAGLLDDALSILYGLEDQNSKDFYDTEIMRLLRGEISAEDLAVKIESRTAIPGPRCAGCDGEHNVHVGYPPKNVPHGQKSATEIARAILKNCESENKTLKSILNRSIAEICSACNPVSCDGDLKCANCKWQRISKGDYNET